MTSLRKQFHCMVTTTVLMTLMIGSAAVAQDAKSDLPSGEEVLQKHIEATGGQMAYDKIENRYFESTLDITGAGITLHLKTYAAKPNKLFSTAKAEAIGTIKKGSTGEVAWTMSDMQGPIVEQGASLENQLRDTALDRLVYWKKAYQSVECVGVENVKDEACYKVILTPHPYKNPELKDAEVSLLTVYFDTQTFLPSKIESNLVTDAGTIDITAYLSDYKTVDGIKLPYRTDLEMAGQTRVMQIQSIQHNLKLAADQFDPPGEIQKLLDKQ